MKQAVFASTFFAMSHGHVLMRGGRRKLITGAAHDGQNIHVVIDSTEYGTTCTDIGLEIEKIGTQAVNIAFGTARVNCDGIKLQFTPTGFTHVISDTGQQVLAVSLGTCVHQWDGDIVEMSCGLNFNDGSDLASARNHVHCSDNACGSLQKYTVKATVSGESDGTSVPFESTCETTYDYHSYPGRDDFCILDSCHRCADSYYCADTPDQLGDCENCPDGSDTRNANGEFVPGSGASHCQVCPNGYFQKDTDECQQCPDGSDTRDGPLSTDNYLNEAASHCVECAIGLFQTGTENCDNNVCGDGFQTIKVSGAFTYSGAAICSACEKGKFQTGNSHCMACQDGYDTRDSNGDYALTAATHCVACETGKFAYGGVDMQCLECEATAGETRGFSEITGGYRHVSFGATECSPCEFGFYSHNGECTFCPIGYELQTEDPDYGLEYSVDASTHCSQCPPGKGNSNIGDECEYIVCDSESHKCRESAHGTCGELGRVTCDGSCVNKENVAQSSLQCPTLYGAFDLYSDPDRSHELHDPSYCSVSATETQQLCVEWKGELQNGFDASEVSAIDQSSALCTELKDSYDTNDVKATAPPTCQAYFNIVAPMYIYPLAWNGTANNILPEWQTLITSATSNPHIKFDIIINPDNGAGALYVQGVASGDNAFKWEAWQQVVAPLQALSNVRLFGYVPTGYGADMGTSVVDLVQAWSTNWNINDIFFDEVNGKVLDDGVYVDTLAAYTTYFNSVTATKICNFGSPQMADGTEYTAPWVAACESNVFAENLWSQASAYQTPAIQSANARSKFAAIYHTAPPSGFDFSEALDVLFDQGFGSVYFTDGVGDNPYIHFLDTWDTFVSHVSQWSLTAYTSRNSCASNPCQNGGNCTDVYNGYQCTCVAGTSGTNCETDIDECATTPCQNGAECFDSNSPGFGIALDEYACLCGQSTSGIPGVASSAGFNGLQCQTDIDECAMPVAGSVGGSSHCPFGTTCTDSTDDATLRVNDYYCDAKSVGSGELPGYPHPMTDGFENPCAYIEYGLCENPLQPGTLYNGEQIIVITPCQQDFHVVSGTCTACTGGQTRPAGDDPKGPDTACE